MRYGKVVSLLEQPIAKHFSHIASAIIKILFLQKRAADVVFVSNHEVRHVIVELLRRLEIEENEAVIVVGWIQSSRFDEASVIKGDSSLAILAVFGFDYLAIVFVYKLDTTVITCFSIWAIFDVLVQTGFVRAV